MRSDFFTQYYRDAHLRYKKVAVLLGGSSAERDISLRSGKAVLDSLQRSSVNAIAFDPAYDSLEMFIKSRFDCAFVVLHGSGGEDGVIQGFLQASQIDYTGTGVLGSAISMDKVTAKILWKACNIATPDYAVGGKELTFEHARSTCGLPMIVKPRSGGSSVGTHRVTSQHEFDIALSDALLYDKSVLVESWIHGTEYTTGILSDKALPLIKLETPRAFYDYKAKYVESTTNYICPCGLFSKQEIALQATSLEAFHFLHASGWGRVDFILDQDDKPWFIEVNTIPGMTDHSLLPIAANELGISFDDLVLLILDTANQDASEARLL